MIKRVKRIYEETAGRIRNGKMSEQFWTTKGVRQGYILSPLFFNVYMANLEEELRKRGVGGRGIGKERI